MTGAALKGYVVILRKVLTYRAVRSRKVDGKVTRVELLLECGHCENIKLSRIKCERYRCSECSEQVKHDRVVRTKSGASRH